MNRLPTLTPRLQCVADNVRRGCRVIDVGCDHAHLPVYLVGSGHCTSALATDIRRGPCDSARATIRQYGLENQIEVVQTGGLQGLAFSSFDDVVIAGMGGETMVHILLSRPDVLSPDIGLVLQPQTDLPLVRAHLYRQGYAFAEQLAAEEPRLYHILRADLLSGQRKNPSLSDLEIGSPQGTHGQISHYYQKLRNTLTVRLNGMRCAVSPDAETISAVKQIEAVLVLLAEQEKQHESHRTTTF